MLWLVVHSRSALVVKSSPGDRAQFPDTENCGLRLPPSCHLYPKQLFRLAVYTLWPSISRQSLPTGRAYVMGRWRVLILAKRAFLLPLGCVLIPTHNKSSHVFGKRREVSKSHVFWTTYHIWWGNIKGTYRIKHPIPRAIKLIMESGFPV